MHIHMRHTHIYTYIHVCMQVGCPVYSDRNMRSWHLKLQIPYFKLYSKNLTCYSTCNEILTSDLCEKLRARTHTNTHHTQAVICPYHLKNETEFVENILLQNSTKICTTYDQYSFCTLKYELHQRLIC